MGKCHYISKGNKITNDKNELLTVDFFVKPVEYMTMENCIKNHYKISEIAKKFVTVELDDEKLYNKKVREISLSLAHAIDNNDIETIKKIKQIYINDKEFNLARDLLNEKCKQVWDVLNSKNIFLTPPKECLKILGITNQPSLDYLLSDSLNFFEIKNADVTSKIITSILNNRNLSYTLVDIHKYLKQKCRNCNIKLGLKTLKYFVEKHGYTSKKLIELGADKKTIKKIYNFKLLINNIKSAFC